MRTTIDLPENLVKEAMKACRVSTKTGVIILALKDLIRKSKISGLKKFKGRIDLETGLDNLRKRQ